MRKIISARISPFAGAAPGEFFRGSSGTVKRKIITLINSEPDAEFDVLIDDNGRKYIKKSSDLVGETINVMDETTVARFEDGNVVIEDVVVEGALPQQKTVDQLKKLRKSTRKTDIGDRISDMNKEGANIQYIHNPIDTGIESQQNYEKGNKKFKPNQNLKHLSSFSSYNK